MSIYRDINDLNLVQNNISINQNENDPIEQFRKKYSPKIKSEKMKEYVERGNKILDQLTDHTIEISTSDISEDDHRMDIACLMWALTAKAANQGDAYKSGAMRINNGADKNGEEGKKFGQRFEDYLKGGDKPSGYYSRISTHMNENLRKGETAYGLDLEGMDLPAEKGTILFAKQPDGSIFIKLEEHGFPGFNSWKNASTSIAHSIDYLKSRIFGKPEGARSEQVPTEVKKKFKKVIEEKYGKKTWSDVIFGKSISKTRGEEFYREGKTFGLSRMKIILSKIFTDEEEKIKFKAAIEEFEKAASIYDDRAKKNGYKGEYKGNEVLIELSIR